MFQRILIANRGEIALRVIRACHDLGIEAVAVFSEADRGAPYLALADAAICIGPAESAGSYLNMATIIRDCCRHLEESIRLVRNLRNAEKIQEHVREITRLENEADGIYRDCESVLFATPPEILLLIKLRELYGWLEETVDACKDVAMIISEIVIKGS